MFKFDVKSGLFLKGDDQIVDRFLAINWNITGCCQNSCAYCYGKDIVSRKGATGARLKTIAHNIVNLHPDLIVITGGEPLLFSNLSCVLEFLLKNDINVILDTSGIIDLSQFETILGKIHTRISLDSIIPEINESIRISSIPNSTDFIKKQLLMMKQKDYPVSVQTTLTDINYKYIMGMAKFLSDNSISYWRLGFVIPHITELESRTLPNLKKIISEFPELNIRVTNWNAETCNHVILVDPQGNVLIRNATNNIKVTIGNLAETAFSEKDLLSRIDLKTHMKRYFYEKEILL